MFGPGAEEIVSFDDDGEDLDMRVARMESLRT